MLILGVILGAIWLGYVATTAPFGAVHGEGVRQTLDGASLAEVTIAVHIEASTGLGNVRVDGDYTQQGNIYQSSNYDTTFNRIELTVTGGIGSLSGEQQRTVTFG